MNLRNWIERLAAGHGYRLTKEMAQEYLSELSRLKLTDQQWEVLLRREREQCADFPSLAQLWHYAREITLASQPGAGVQWVTHQDEQGRTWARRARQ
jgi:hypothetical protein